MSDQSAQPESAAPETEPGTAPAQESTPQGPPEWLGPIEDRMNELREQNAALHEQFQSAFTPYEEDDDEDFDFEDDEGNLTPEGAQAIIDSRVDEILSQRLGERDAGEALNVRNLAYEELRERVPQLQDAEYATQLVQELAAELREAGYEALVQTPLFVDLIEQRHKAIAFDERAAEEAPPQRGVVLESAGGAAPNQRQEQVDWADRVAKAAEKVHPRI